MKHWKDLKQFLKEVLNLGCKVDREIISRSNVIQYDEMGYPLRLCIVRDGGVVDQVWIDTIALDGDVVLQWE